MAVETSCDDTHTDVLVRKDLGFTRNPYQQATADSDESKKTLPIRQHRALRYHVHSLVPKNPGLWENLAIPSVQSFFAVFIPLRYAL